MTREAAKQILLKDIEEYIKLCGEDGIALECPMPGKNSWTWKECKEAVINDTDLEGVKNTNPIDTFLEYVKYCLEHGLEKCG